MSGNIYLYEKKLNEISGNVNLENMVSEDIPNEVALPSYQYFEKPAIIEIRNKSGIHAISPANKYYNAVLALLERLLNEPINEFDDSVDIATLDESTVACSLYFASQKINELDVIGEKIPKKVTYDEIVFYFDQNAMMYKCGGKLSLKPIGLLTVGGDDGTFLENYQ